jgi:hypothetical protein
MVLSKDMIERSVLAKARKKRRRGDNFQNHINKNKQEKLNVTMLSALYVQPPDPKKQPDSFENYKSIALENLIMGIRCPLTRQLKTH